MIIPSNILVERMLTKLAFRYGHVNDFLIAVLAYDDRVYLDYFTLPADEPRWHGQTFTQLLNGMPEGYQLLGIYPSDVEIQKRLKNSVGDFDRHFIASPAHANRFNYCSQAGDIGMILRYGSTDIRRRD